MRDADAFDGAVFVGLSRNAKRDPYRLSLFAQHLDADEMPRIVLAVHGGTVLVTDRRLLELRAHLEVHGAWNVKEFQGYTVHRSIDLSAIRDVAHAVSAAGTGGSHEVADRVRLTTADGTEDFLISKGPTPALSDDEFALLRETILGRQAK